MRESVDRLLGYVFQYKGLLMAVRVGSGRLSVRKLVEEALARKR